MDLASVRKKLLKEVELDLEELIGGVCTEHLLRARHRGTEGKNGPCLCLCAAHILVKTKSFLGRQGEFLSKRIVDLRLYYIHQMLFK